MILTNYISSCMNQKRSDGKIKVRIYSGQIQQSYCKMQGSTFEKEKPENFNQKYNNILEYNSVLESALQELKSHFTSISNKFENLYKETSLETKNFIKRADLYLLLSTLELPSLANTDSIEQIVKLIMKRERMSKYELQAAFQELLWCNHKGDKSINGKPIIKLQSNQRLKNILRLKTQLTQYQPKRKRVITENSFKNNLSLKTQVQDHTINTAKKKVNSLKQLIKITNHPKTTSPKETQLCVSHPEQFLRLEVLRILLQLQQKQEKKEELFIIKHQDEKELEHAKHFCFLKYNDMEQEQKYFANKLQNLLKQKKVFQDEKNPLPLDKSHIYTPVEKVFKEKSYVVISQQPISLESYKNISYKHVKQGQVGNCYFLSVLGGISDAYPKKIADLFLFEKNPSNYLAVRLFVDGQWKTIELDNKFPCINNQLWYSKSYKNEIWAMLIEKAFAKVHGSYRAIGQGGWSSQSFLALTGAPCRYFQFYRCRQEKRIQKLQEQLEKGYILQACIKHYIYKETKQSLLQKGLAMNHSYSILAIIQINKHVYVKVKNPWSDQKVWKGNWDQVYKGLTNEEKLKLNYDHQKKNGVFFIQWTDFLNYFDGVNICTFNPTYTHTSLRLNFNNKKSNYVKMTINKSEVYTIFICQQSRKKYKLVNPNYKQSDSRLLIMKKNQDGTLTFIAAQTEIRKQTCMVEAYLKKGQYIISSKIEWKQWIDHSACLVSYGCSKVNFKLIEDRKIAPAFKHFLIEGFINQNKRKAKQFIKTYGSGNQTIGTRGWYMGTLQGIGYMKYVNNSSRVQHVTFEFQFKGIKMITAYKEGTIIKIMPKQEYKVGFFVKSNFEFQCEAKIK